MQQIKPPSQATAVAWEENQRRRRMLEGAWDRDLQSEILDGVSRRRASVWGHGDTAKNLALSIINQLARLYDRPASPIHETDGAAEEMRVWLRQAAHWQHLQGFSPLIIGQREGLVMCDVVKDPISGEISLLTRTAPADLVHVEAHADRPDYPWRVYEYRPRRDSAGKMVWTRDAWDISTPGDPFFEIQDCDGTTIPGTTIRGEDYLAKWSYASGVPFIPGEWYHAASTGKLRNTAHGKELFDGALKTAALWTFWGHIVRDASWPQRYLSNGRPAGAASTDGDGTPFVEMDPTAILAVEPVEPGIAVILGQFQAGGDPLVIGQSIRDYGADLATSFDIAPGDIERANGDARSGYAVEITKDGMRSAQRRYAMSFERHDSALLNKIAAMLTRSGAADLPDAGWSVEYAGIPLGLSERAQQLDALMLLVDKKMISRPEALARYESIPLSEARKRLAESQDDIARFRE